jgi:hypothetical protein
MISYRTNEGYLIAGSTQSVDGDIAYLHGGQDYWIVSTDYYGNLLWEKTFGGSNGEHLLRIIKTNSEYYLLGSSYSSDGDISNDPYPESTDYWVVKTRQPGQYPLGAHPGWQLAGPDVDRHAHG